MRVDGFEVVQVRLPVLDPPRVVARQEPVLVFAPARRLDRAVVRLQDCLKVEAHPVPQRKLPVLRARQQAPAVGHERHHLDRGSDLVRGDVHELGGEGRGGDVRVGDGREKVQHGAGRRLEHLVVPRVLLVHAVLCGRGGGGDAIVSAVWIHRVEVA